jgi:hypothetical protein
MRVVETIQASGHPKIRATHKTTLEITKDSHVTERGDCIVAVNASKGSRDLSPEFRDLVRNNNAVIRLTMTVARQTETVTGRGDGRLTLDHLTDLVVRKSKYVCNRTLMVEADKSASNLGRDLVKALRDPQARIIMQVQAEVEDDRG